MLLQNKKETVFLPLQLAADGLTEAEAEKKLLQKRKRQKIKKPWLADAHLLLQQFKSPLVLLLVFAVVLSAALGEYSNTAIVLMVLLITGILGFVQERNAGRAVQALQALVQCKATVRRSGKELDVLMEDVVNGDVVLLNAGDMVPADALILNANDLHVNESALTGEAYPVEKFAAALTVSSTVKPENTVYKGTSVINGTATVIALKTGEDTELGKIASSIEKGLTITSFEKGISSFGLLLVRLTVLFSVVILCFNLLFHRPFLDSVLFSLALAVGLTPELLPAILTITLAAGARRMARKKVIVKKLGAIQNLGSIDVLCSDKTGTITQGAMKFYRTVNAKGEADERLLQYACLNALFETDFTNPIDEALRQQANVTVAGFQKCDEVPYDFVRRRLSVVVEKDGRHLMITKGSFRTILDVCTTAETDLNTNVPINEVNPLLQQQFEQYSNQGFRVIAICYKDVTGDPVINKDDETEMTYLGFLLFSDPLKDDVLQSIQELKEKGVALKIITGDNNKVAQFIAGQIHLDRSRILTGGEIASLSLLELAKKATDTDVFAEVLPAQKESIIKALQTAGHTVGYLGDGINDANALHAADVGISVESAVDVAKEAADLVLLDQHLDVISDGVSEGRKTFLNTIKYIHVTTSANFGNMFSMAIASLLFPFMPLLPIQILLNNFLSDLPAFGIASDNVDPELLAGPKGWDLRSIKRFMIVFGLQSSLFDFATFGLLYFIFKVTVPEFRTAWFTESLLTQVLILLVIRTRRPFFKSRPSVYLTGIAAIVFFFGLSLPYWPFAAVFELHPLPFSLFWTILLVATVYIFFAEQTKRYLFRKWS